MQQWLLHWTVQIKSIFLLVQKVLVDSAIESNPLNGQAEKTPSGLKSIPTETLALDTGGRTWKHNSYT
jgi:hypothetical protein